MIHVSLSTPHIHRKMMKVRVSFSHSEENQIVQLSSWRPGRYEMGNFAKNISHVRAFDSSNTPLGVRKTEKDKWCIACNADEQITFEYFYCAAELNAGSTYVNSQMLYVNPVNCIPFLPGRANENYSVEILDSYEHLSCGLPHEGNKMFAQNFDELADSPFVAAHNREVISQEIEGVVFKAHVFGQTNLNFERFWNDVKTYTELQLSIFQEFPVKHYNYLLHFTPYFMHHGVEHTTSTVIVMGDGENFDREEKYNELLAICSHELFHTWNVKTLRPVEMMPYDFTKENYSELGYICEGVTTYMGDLMLYKSGVFSLDQYLLEMNKQLQKHFDNHGRFNYSVAESSFDTWLDGYVPGAPARKVSIYTEGCLLAFVTDVMILEATESKFGLDTVMQRFYFDYYLKGKGVSEEDYKFVLEKVSGISFDSFFEDFVHGNRPYESILTDAFDFIGLELHHKPSQFYSHGRLGFKTIPQGQNFIIKVIYPGSPANLGGLMLEDEIIAVNGYACLGELDK